MNQGTFRTIEIQHCEATTCTSYTVPLHPDGRNQPFLKSKTTQFYFPRSSDANYNHRTNSHYNRCRRHHTMYAQESLPSAMQTATASTSSDKFLRQCLASWAPPISTPPGCRTVSLCNWAGFTAVPAQNLATGELKASDLCKDYGTTPDYNPPASERCYLGVDQPISNFQYEHVSRAGQRRRQQRSAATSWGTVSEQGEDGAKPAPASDAIQFCKQTPKCVDTKSQLTACLKMKAAKEEMKTFAEMMRSRAMTCEGLPSAFDSDEEDE